MTIKGIVRSRRRNTLSRSPLYFPQLGGHVRDGHCHVPITRGEIMAELRELRSNADEFARDRVQGEALRRLVYPSAATAVNLPHGEAWS